MITIPRTAMEAMDRWRNSVRDAAVLVLLERCPEPMPLHTIAARIGVDHHGLRAVLEPDRRLAVHVGRYVRPERGRPESAIFVRLRHSPGVAAADAGGKSGENPCRAH